MKTFPRRRFATATAGITAATIVPASVLGGGTKKPPSETLNIAGIGVGGQGAADLKAVSSEHIVALCDVDERRASGTFKRYPKAARYKDFRKMLEKEADRIDAVVVATPDHVHAPAAMAAIKAGKHVYCEKPLTHSVREARRVAEAARKHGVATQMGNQGQASERTRRICEYIQGGAIGTVREVHVWTDRPMRGLLDTYWPQGVKRPAATPPVPAGLDWDLWLGPAPQRPYHPAYLPFTWRGWWDFGTGALGDIGCHALDPVFRALKLGRPESVWATSSLVNEETYPLSSIVRYWFPARGELPPVTLTWYDGGMKPPRPTELPDGRNFGANGTLYVGDEGMMLGAMIIPEKRRRAFDPPPKTIPRSPGHHREWLDACRGGTPAGSNFDWAGPLAEAVLLGNIALRRELRNDIAKMRLRWDGEKMKVTNLPAANRFIRREYRAGWTL